MLRQPKGSELSRKWCSRSTSQTIAVALAIARKHSKQLGIFHHTMLRTIDWNSLLNLLFIHHWNYLNLKNMLFSQLIGIFRVAILVWSFGKIYSKMEWSCPKCFSSTFFCGSGKSIFRHEWFIWKEATWITSQYNKSKWIPVVCNILLFKCCISKKLRELHNNNRSVSW